MSDETRDPRLPVLANELLVVFELGTEGYKERHAVDGRTVKALARLDAADPRRAMWGEVVEALEAADDEIDGWRWQDDSQMRAGPSEVQRKIHGILTRLRTLTPTEGGN